MMVLNGNIVKVYLFTYRPKYLGIFWVIRINRTNKMYEIRHFLVIIFAKLSIKHGQ